MLKFTVKGGFTDANMSRILGKAGKKGAKTLVGEIDTYTDKITDQAATESARKAPILTGRLRNNIQNSKESIRPMAREYGSGDVDYAAIQEYEHATKSGFFRKTIWEIRNPYSSGIRDILRRHGGL